MVPCLREACVFLFLSLSLSLSRARARALFLSLSPLSLLSLSSLFLSFSLSLSPLSLGSPRGMWQLYTLSRTITLDVALAAPATPSRTEDGTTGRATTDKAESSTEDAQAQILQSDIPGLGFRV